MLRNALVPVSLMLLTSLVASACASTEDETSDGTDSAIARSSAVCTQLATYPNQPLADIVKAQGGTLAAPNTAMISNYTAWPTYDPNPGGGAYDASIVRARTDPKEAVANLASRFSSCEGAVKKHLETKKPNIYIYFTGFGGAAQNNSLVDEGAILRWINQRDPNGLIYSINWNCAGSHDAFCKDNAAKLKLKASTPEVKRMTEVVGAAAPAARPVLDNIMKMTEQNQEGYDTALSHAMQLGALLVDQLVVADGAPGSEGIGDIHFLGYSMGAHAASQILIQDFVGDGSGFKWTRPGQCDDGKNACTLAHLNKVKWSLSLGLSGWSEALRSYNQFDAAGRTKRNAGDAAQHYNGGLLRVSDPRFNGKGNVFNRRMDPTGNSDDTLQRGFNDVFFRDYNHNSHDYALPSFVNPSFVAVLDAFLASPRAKDVKELGAIFDNAGMIDFDECPATGSCEARTGYLAHAANRSHERLKIIKTDAVTTTDGVPHPERKSNRAVRFASGSKPIVLDTFEQEDLRGGIELYYRPQFEPASAGTRGVFSYGGCGTSASELMPEAYVKDGTLVFAMSYQGKRYEAAAKVSTAALNKGAWTHLAFNWELPVVTLADPQQPSFAADARKYGVALALASGLSKASPTTYKRQQGEGKLTIYANGKAVTSAALGSARSERDCLAAATVLGNRSYDADGESYPAFSPYASYSSGGGDAVQMGLGTLCKAYRVRNEQAFFGCAQSPSGVNADADMDDITLVWGPGRTSFDDVDSAKGTPKLWPIGSTYGASPTP